MIIIKIEINNLKRFISNLDNLSQIITIGMILLFVLLFCISVVRPIIDWIFINILHKREMDYNNQKYLNNQLGKIIDFKIDSKLKQEEANTATINKIIDKLNNIKEE